MNKVIFFLFLLVSLCVAPVKALAQDQNARYFFEQGVQFYTAQDYTKAKSYFTKAYNTEAQSSGKGHWKALTYRGKCNRNLYDYESAIKDFDGVIALKSDYARAYRYRGYCKYLLERYDEAIEDLNLYLYLAKVNEEEYEKGYYWRGLCNQNLGYDEDAISDFSKAILYKTTEGVYSEAHLARAKSYTIKGDYSYAVEDAFTAMENDDNCIQEGLETVIYSFIMEQGLSVQYKNKMLNLIKLYPAWTSKVFLLYGQKAIAEEKYDKAIETFKKAFDSAVNDAERYEATTSIAATYWFYLKDDAQALTYYKKAKGYAVTTQDVQDIDAMIALLDTKQTRVKPSIIWTNPKQSNTTSNERQILINACPQSEENITGTRLIVNGQQQRGQGVVAANTTCTNGINQIIALQEGTNTIQFEVTNSTGTTIETRTIAYTKPKPKLDKENNNPNAIVIVKDTTSQQNNAKIEKRIALVIGNGNYAKNPLKNAVNDANSMETVLKECGFEVVKITNSDKKTLKTAIKTFSDNLKNYDVGLFFYAGHGLEIDGVNYIMPTDVTDALQRTDVSEECISTTWVQERMADAGSRDKTNIIILDACRNNPFRAWSRDASSEAWVTPKSVPTGVITCYAASQGETASDGENGNGLYTATLLKYIKIPNAPIEQVFKKVRIELLSKKAQEPMEMSKLTKEFHFLQPK